MPQERPGSCRLRVAGLRRRFPSTHGRTHIDHSANHWTQFFSTDDVDALTLRYRTAFEQYQDIVDKNAEASLMGDKPSPQAQLEEERAFDALDSARYALLDAAAQAYPTIH